MSNGDKILSENYFQHADHFVRILSEQENFKLSKVNNEENKNKIEVIPDNTVENNKKQLDK